uniref:hypothetical protein n=1 Tax=Candidatus Wunengus sp. YC60 TaxID=3367697 RepID=UPI004024DAED
MAVLAMLEDIEESSKDVTLPWTPEVRKDMKDMIKAGKDLRIKMNKLGFDMRDLPPYINGEEKDYFTKPS